MPIFISYAREDREFALKLSRHLVSQKTPVWIDEWEINAGDSLITTIQAAIERASALIVIFSKASVTSTWCQKEVVSGIQRELDEKRVVVIPVKLEDCEIPLFLRDKRYADFRTNYDDGLRTIEAAVAKFSNPAMSRIEHDEYFTDWSYHYGDLRADGQPDAYRLNFTIVKQSKKWDYSVVTKIDVFVSPEATDRFKVFEKAGFREIGHLMIIESFLNGVEDKLPILLKDTFPVEFQRTCHDPRLNFTYIGSISSQKVGNDNGKDILIHGREEIEQIRDMIKERIRPPSPQKFQELMKIIASRP